MNQKSQAKASSVSPDIDVRASRVKKVDCVKAIDEVYTGGKIEIQVYAFN